MRTKRGRVTWMAVMAMVATGLAATGCQLSAPQPAALDYPADFSLVLTVAGPDPQTVAGDVPADGQQADKTEGEGGPAEPARTDAPSPLAQPAQHVVLPDRMLRVALGHGASHDYFPGPTARLRPAQMAELWRLVQEGSLLADAPDAAQADAAEPVYRLAITVDGRTHHHVTTPSASPGAVALLAELVDLRGGR